MQPSNVAVIGAGEMGAAVAKRLHDGGCSVVVSVAGRSAASRHRVAALGIASVDTIEDVVAQADLVLSIVPPGQARRVAQTVAVALRAAPRAVTYADCNAVSPHTVRDIEATVHSAGAAFVDAGIIGGPPRHGEAGPIIFVSGAQADRLIALRAAGLDVRGLGDNVGSASALKLSYAGITKGLTALGALMQLHADKHGLRAELDGVLRETRPDLADFLEHAVPGMRPKAYRWVAEMREIADFTAPDEAGESIYQAAALFYERIAHDVALTT